MGMVFSHPLWVCCLQLNQESGKPTTIVAVTSSSCEDGATVRLSGNDSHHLELRIRVAEEDAFLICASTIGGGIPTKIVIGRARQS